MSAEMYLHGFYQKLDKNWFTGALGLKSFTEIVFRVENMSSSCKKTTRLVYLWIQESGKLEYDLEKLVFKNYHLSFCDSWLM